MLEDEIHRIKAEHCAKLLELQESGKIRHLELSQSVEALQKKTLKLQNSVFALETALTHSKETLKAEKARWDDERGQLLDENSQLHEELNRLRALDPSTNNNSQRLEQHYESELEQLRAELQTVITSDADARRSLQLASDRATRLQCEAEVHLQRLKSHQSEIEAFQSQFTGTKEREAVLTEKLVGFRDRNSELQSKLSQLQLQSTQSAMHTNVQQQQQHTTLMSRLSHAEVTNEQLSLENRMLHEQLTKLHVELNRINAISSNSNSSTGGANGSVFAVHVELKRENSQLRVQVDELKQLQKRFLTTAKKKTMSFPAI